MQTHYSTLQVSPTASQAEIKKQYRLLAKQYHPDVNPSGDAMFKQVQHAYSILSDPKRRRAYDAALFSFVRTASQPKPPPSGAEPKKNRDPAYRRRKTRPSATQAKARKKKQTPQHPVVRWLYGFMAQYPVLSSFIIFFLIVLFFFVSPRLFVHVTIYALAVAIVVRVVRLFV